MTAFDSEGSKVRAMMATTVLVGGAALLVLCLLACSSRDSVTGEPETDWSPSTEDVQKIVRRAETVFRPGGGLKPVEEDLLLYTMSDADHAAPEREELQEILEVFQAGWKEGVSFRVLSYSFAPVMVREPDIPAERIPFSVILKPVDSSGQDLDGRIFLCGLLFGNSDDVLITWLSWDHDGRW